MLTTSFCVDHLVVTSKALLDSPRGEGEDDVMNPHRDLESRGGVDGVAMADATILSRRLQEEDEDETLALSPRHQEVAQYDELRNLSPTVENVPPRTMELYTELDAAMSRERSKGVALIYHIHHSHSCSKLLYFLTYEYSSLASYRDSY